LRTSVNDRCLGAGGNPFELHELVEVTVYSSARRAQLRGAQIQRAPDAARRPLTTTFAQAIRATRVFVDVHPRHGLGVNRRVGGRCPVASLAATVRMGAGAPAAARPTRTIAPVVASRGQARLTEATYRPNPRLFFLSAPLHRRR